MIYIISLLLSFSLLASEFGSSGYEVNHSSDYLHKRVGTVPHTDTDFGGIDLNSELNVKTSCGALDFKSSLQSSIEEITDVKGMEEKLKRMSIDFIGGLPLMTLAYMSPETAAMVKHFEKQASFRLNARLDQCAIMESYVDDRTAFSREKRSTCVSQELSRNGADIERAIKKCKERGHETPSISGNKVELDSNGRVVRGSKPRLLADSMKWARVESKERVKAVNLAMKLVGEEVFEGEYYVTKFDGKPETISSLRGTQELETFKALNALIEKINRLKNTRGDYYPISDKELAIVNKGLFGSPLDRETIINLSYLPDRKRQHYLRLFSFSLAGESLKRELNLALETLPKLALNPNLNTTQKDLIYKKIDLIKLNQELLNSGSGDRGTSYSSIMFDANKRALASKNQFSKASFSFEKSFNTSNEVRKELYNCADEVFCERE